MAGLAVRAATDGANLALVADELLARGQGEWGATGWSHRLAAHRAAEVIASEFEPSTYRDHLLRLVVLPRVDHFIDGNRCAWCAEQVAAGATAEELPFS